MGTFGKHSGWIQSDYQKNKMRDPIDTYISEAPQEHQEALIKIRDILRKELVPLGFEECITYGMIGYIVPFSTYPQGYHTDKKQPLPFVCLATKKAGVHLYHMWVSADTELLKWWQDSYAKENIGKLDMWVGCIRFKKLEKIPYDLIWELAKKLTAQEWINLYEKRYVNKK